MTNFPETLVVGAAQIAPAWLNRERTIEKVVDWVGRAADQGCNLVAFGEAFVPGYPFWVERTDGARFESRVQKELYAHYADQAVCLELGHLDPVCRVARDRTIAVYLGCIERAANRGQSVFCSLVYINADGVIGSVHRKLMPTFEERLVWSTGDGHGLRTHSIGRFTAGGLNCWENWMPLPRAALYGMGEDLHVAVWPGNIRNTQDITRFLAREGRSFVISVCGLMRGEDVPEDLPYRDLMLADGAGSWANGGSCIAGPDGAWVVAPAAEGECLIFATIDHRRVREERQNFDPAGHYSRPDVTRLIVNRERQSTIDVRE